MTQGSQNHAPPHLPRRLFPAARRPRRARPPARKGGDWPARNVTIVVPFPPGSSSDIVARAVAQPMQQALGKPVVVENRPGATGEIGARSVARSAPDGYTLMHAPISTWAINVPLRPKLAYDPVKQFTPVTQTVRTPNVLVVNPQQVPADDLAGLRGVAEAPRHAGLLLHQRHRLLRPPDDGDVQAGHRHGRGARALRRRRAGDHGPDRRARCRCRSRTSARSRRTSRRGG